MANSVVSPALPENEPIRTYAPGSGEKASLKRALETMCGERIEIPLVIGGRDVFTGKTIDVICPHDHKHVLAVCHLAGPAEVEQAVAASRAAWDGWSRLDWRERAGVFLRAAELASHSQRDVLNAATMLNQSKTVYQAEIDAACELIDFWRFNVAYMQQIYAEQPFSVPGVVNWTDYRPLEGFVFAISPFNFTSIAGNLPSAPALMGNTVLWKPASTALLSGYYVMRLLQAAGLPEGVINFLPGAGAAVGGAALSNPAFAGLHFTGSTQTFQSLWKAIGANIENYIAYPRVVGETGGKNFIFADVSADVPVLAVALIRGAFEYQGQKCSAASRAYIPRSLWPALKDRLLADVARISWGSPTDFSHFMGALISAEAFAKVKSYLELARASSDVEFVYGGQADDKVGYFVQPTVLLTTNPRHRLMEEEIFGPVLTLYVYDDRDVDETLQLCATTSRYGLTGAIFARDRHATARHTAALRFCAGNFYINDKPTGAVVGQQPFGGSRASGTNDKAGSYLNLLRWTSPCALKENLLPPTDFAYPHMRES